MRHPVSALARRSRANGVPSHPFCSRRSHTKWARGTGGIGLPLGNGRRGRLTSRRRGRGCQRSAKRAPEGQCQACQEDQPGEGWAGRRRPRAVWLHERRRPRASLGRGAASVSDLHTRVSACVYVRRRYKRSPTSYTGDPPVGMRRTAPSRRPSLPTPYTEGGLVGTLGTATTTAAQ